MKRRIKVKWKKDGSVYHIRFVELNFPNDKFTPDGPQLIIDGRFQGIQIARGHCMHIRGEDNRIPQHLNLASAFRPDCADSLGHTLSMVVVWAKDEQKRLLNEGALGHR